MALGIFIALFVLYLVLGVLHIPKKDLRSFMFWTIVLPLAPALTAIHTKFQFSVYYGFLVVPLVAMVFLNRKRIRIHKETALSLLLLLLLLLIYLPLGRILSSDESTWIHVLKDVKPILFLFVAFVFLDWIKGHELSWSGSFSKNLLILNFVATIAFFFILNNTSFLSAVTGDPFYLANQARYLSLGTFFVIFYLLAKLASSEGLKLWEIVLVFVPVLLSGNRTILVVLLLLILLNVILSMSDPVRFLKRFALVAIGGIGLALGIVFSSREIQGRLVSLLNVEQLVTELMERRFSPFIAQLDTFSWYNFLIGKGIGEPFFIPWFTYRENIEDYNIYMDNLYMTLYVKYGLGMFVVLLCLFYFVNRTRTTKRFKTLVLCYFLIMGLTTSFIYQYSFLFIILMLGVYTNVKVESARE